MSRTGWARRPPPEEVRVEHRRTREPALPAMEFDFTDERPVVKITYPALDEETRRQFLDQLRALGNDHAVRLPSEVKAEHLQFADPEQPK